MDYCKKRKNLWSWTVGSVIKPKKGFYESVDFSIGITFDGRTSWGQLLILSPYSGETPSPTHMRRLETKGVYSP